LTFVYLVNVFNFNKTTSNFWHTSDTFCSYVDIVLTSWVSRSVEERWTGYWFSNKCTILIFTFYHSIHRRSFIFYGENCLFAILHMGKCKITTFYKWYQFTRSLVFCVVFCRSLFVLLWFCLPLCCLSFFDLRILIISLWYLQTLLERLQIALKIYFNNLTS